MTPRDISGQGGRHITALLLAVVDWIKAGPMRVPVQRIRNWVGKGQKIIGSRKLKNWEHLGEFWGLWPQSVNSKGVRRHLPFCGLSCRDNCIENEVARKGETRGPAAFLLWSPVKDFFPMRIRNTPPSPVVLQKPTSAFCFFFFFFGCAGS